MALKNLKEYVPPIKAHNAGVVKVDQIELTTRAAVPTADLSNGRLVYVTGTGFRMYNESAWVTIPTSTTGGSASSWETLYSADKTLDITAGTLSFAGAHASNDVFTLTNASGTGVCLQITNSGTGDDIQGTSDTWNVGKTGIAVFDASVTTAAIVGSANLTIDATSAGTITLGATSTGAITLTRAVTATASVTITGSTETDVLVITDGDQLIDDGHLTITQTNTGSTPGGIDITTSTQTTHGILITADGITSGAALYVDSDNGASFSGDGGYLNLMNGTSSVFKVQRYGATTIAGNAGTTVLTITAGDFLMSEGSFQQTDDDNAATMTVINDGATTVGAASSDAGVVDLEFDELTTGQGVYIEVDKLTTGSALSIDNGGATLTTGYFIECGDDGTADFTVGADGAVVITATQTSTAALTMVADAVTNTDVVTLSVDGLVAGDAVFIENVGETLAAGELLKIANTESGALATKTGNLCSITSSMTLTSGGDTTEDYDMLLLSRSDVTNAAQTTYTAQGSVLKILHTSTETQTTLADTVIALEVEQSGGTGVTGDLVKFTGVATGGETLNIISASTTVSDVLITGSGAKADNKAVLEVVSTGNTAAGGALLRVAPTSGTPAAATSYLVDFDYTSAVCGTNNPDLLHIAAEGTGRALHITTSGAADPLIDFESTEAGTTGVVLKLNHQGGSQTTSDVVARIEFAGEDGQAADNDYAKIDVVAADATPASEDGDMKFYVCRAATNTLQLTLDSDVNGILVGDGAASAIISSIGTYDLELTTNTNGASDPTIVITDGANGDITLTPKGTGLCNIVGAAFTVTAKTTTATLTEAEGGIITVTTGAAWTATLPAASGNAGLWYAFKKTDAAANALTIDGNGAETIDGAATHTAVDAQYDTVTIVCDGSNWHVISEDLA